MFLQEVGALQAVACQGVTMTGQCQGTGVVTAANAFRIGTDGMVAPLPSATPTLAQPPLPLGSFDSPAEDPMRGMKVSAEFAPFTPICNMTGQPAMSMPLLWNADGLPIGTHFVGRFGDEATLFRLAAQLEAARPWAGRRPPVSA